MRLEFGTRVTCTDGELGGLIDVVVDPATKTLTHLVVEPHRGDWVARLVPIELAEAGADGRTVALRSTLDEVRRLPPAREVAYPRLGDFPVDDPAWDVSIRQVLAVPSYTVYDLEPNPLDYGVIYDRIPKGEVEIGRASSVASADGHHLGHVNGFVVDRDDHITHLVLERGHPWEWRELTIPIGAVARVETGTITLRQSKDEVEALREVSVQRRPPPGLRSR